MSEIDPIPWASVTDDGFAYAEVAAPPFEHIDIPGISMSFCYTGDASGRIRLYRDLSKPDGETWILYTDQTGEPSTADDALWRLTGINPPQEGVPA